MSITDDIRKRVLELEGSQFFFLEPMPGTSCVRDLVVSTQVRHGIIPPFPGSRDRHGNFVDTLDNFLGGSTFTVSEDPFSKPGNTMMARTSPIEKEVWDFRCFDQNNGIRCFGCFGGKDFFIALTWEYRETIEDFSATVGEATEAWKSLFGLIPPFNARTIDEYLTRYIVV